MTKLAISEEEFRAWFPGREDIWELLNSKPRTEGEFITKYLPSKLWRINNLYYIINKKGKKQQFRMNRAQFFAYSFLFQHHRLIILKSRQQGISTLFLVSFSDDSIFRKNLNCGLMAQDKDSASTLLERVEFLWDSLDPQVKDFLNRTTTTMNKSEFGFNNLSKIYVKTSFRSATLHRLHISELGKIANKYPEKARETKTGSLQALYPPNQGIVESTAEGDNMFKQFWDDAQDHFAANNLSVKDFLPVFLPWVDDPDCISYNPEHFDKEARDYFSKVEAATGRILLPEQKNFWVMQRRELAGDVYQEYPATPEEAFAAAKDGTYWAMLYIQEILHKGRRRPKLYDKGLEVYCVMDLGRNDYNVLLFFQVYRNSVRIIHEYYNCGKGLKHYADKLKEFKKEFGWEIEEIGLPHDGDVVDLSEEGDRTREEILNDYGIDNTEVMEKQGIAVGIELVRELMPYIYIDEDCGYLHTCFLKFTKKWNPLIKNWDKEPARTEYKHGADAIRYMAQYVHTYLGFDFRSNKDYTESTDSGNVIDGMSI